VHLAHLAHKIIDGLAVFARPLHTVRYGRLTPSWGPYQ
jgi:hypothetical protein